MNNTLLICAAVGIWPIEGNLYFDRKFYDGLIMYKAHWPGELRVLMKLDYQTKPNFGSVAYDKNSCPFKLIVIQPNEIINSKHLAGVNIVLASADDFNQLHLSQLCKKLSIRCIYVIEYTFKTNIQILMVSKLGLWKKFKSFIWRVIQEIRLQKALRLASSIQSNGIAAYFKYSKLAPNSILYYDTRNTKDMLIVQDSLEERLRYLDQNKALRLAFSGRLIEMKGANDLIEMAYEIKKIGLAFSLDIFGSGSEKDNMLQKINEYSLQNHVKIHGAVDYEAVLVPFVRTAVDVFICCHKQGDPSCTYLETYACGVPIVGYANEAHAGILTQADVGWSAPIGKVNKLVKIIENINQDRSQIKIKARNAIDFAQNHTFESIFKVRMEHCADILNRN